MGMISAQRLVDSFPAIFFSEQRPASFSSEVREKDQPMPTDPNLTIDIFKTYLSEVESSCSPETQISSPHDYKKSVADTKLCRALLHYLLALIDLGVWNISDSQRVQIDDLLNTADELVDTLSWAAEAPDALLELIEQDQCA